MIFYSVVCLSLLSYSAASLDGAHAIRSLSTTHHKKAPAKRAQSNPDPVVGGTTDGGWQYMPDIPDATAIADWVVDEKLDAKIPVFQSSGIEPTNVKRAVIILPGKPRDCWYYWNVMNNALYVANEADPTVKREEVSILSPCFFNAADLAAGAATSDQLIWGDTTWVSGFSNVGPDSITDFSAYDVLDSLVDYYMDTELYPNLTTVVIGGHSAGAQMAQRYLALRKSKKNDDRLHFWIANPGSILWLTNERPVPNTTCDGWDEFKYGLDGGFPAYATKDAKKLERDGIVSRYRQRYAHYAWGLADNGPGDTRCEALTQGSSHLERGSNFVAMLESMQGGMPNHTTVDWVEGASHDNVEMMNSAAGINKLFQVNYNGSAVVYATSGEPDYEETTDGALSFSISRSIVLLCIFASSTILL